MSKPTTQVHKKTNLSKAIHSASRGEEVTIDLEDDASFLAKNPVNWDDLSELKTDLGNTIMEFTSQVQAATTSPLVVNNLGARAEEFRKLVTLFFSDMTDFSASVKSLRSEHEHLSGNIDNLKDYNEYNRIAIAYHNLFMELNALVTPTMSSIVVVIGEVTTDMDDARKAEEALNSKVTDVVDAELITEEKE